jgi:hypothetical protein
MAEHVQFCCTKQCNTLGMHEAAMLHCLLFMCFAHQYKLCHMPTFLLVGGYKQMGQFHGQEVDLTFLNHSCGHMQTAYAA